MAGRYADRKVWELVVPPEVEAIRYFLTAGKVRDLLHNVRVVG